MRPAAVPLLRRPIQSPRNAVSLNCADLRRCRPTSASFKRLAAAAGREDLDRTLQRPLPWRSSKTRRTYQPPRQRGFFESLFGGGEDPSGGAACRPADMAATPGADECRRRRRRRRPRRVPGRVRADLRRRVLPNEHVDTPQPGQRSPSCARRSAPIRRSRSTRAIPNSEIKTAVEAGRHALHGAAQRPEVPEELRLPPVPAGRPDKILGARRWSGAESRARQSAQGRYPGDAGEVRRDCRAPKWTAKRAKAF